MCQVNNHWWIILLVMSRTNVLFKVLKNEKGVLVTNFHLVITILLGPLEDVETEYIA